jgi:TetR/AcrR family transcriptional regulator, ethionamide resistance regulator
MEAQVRSGQRAVKGPRRRRDDLILDALERLLAEVPMRELDVEAIAAEAGITRTRFYAYFTSKNDALAALLRRMGGILANAYEHPGSWFVGRPPHVRPRDALRQTIEVAVDSWWPHRFVLREASDLWSAAPEVRDAWLTAFGTATAQLEQAILRERELGVAPPGYDARRVAEALTWQAERLHFLAWTELPGAMSKQQLCEVSLEAFMRTIFLADDPDPEAPQKLAGRSERPHAARP